MSDQVVNRIADKMENVEDLISKMAQDFKRLAKESGVKDPVMVGIRTGGVWVAERLHQLLKIKEPLSILDINFYRDDFSQSGLYPTVQPSEINSDINNRHIILVDDVLHTGRTINAALNALSDYGRPSCVSLAVLIDRGGRELPIQADIVASSLQLSHTQHIKLQGPEPLKLEIA